MNAVTSTRPPPRRDLGRLVAGVLCVVFAILGLVPLVAAGLLKSPAVTAWASRETARLLEDQLGVTARYRVEVGLLPLELAVYDLEVEAADRGPPALSVQRASIRPRLFALLGGKFEVDDIVVDQPRVRLVVSGGKLVNLSYRLPERKQPASARSDRPPFLSLSVNDARGQVEVDGASVDLGSLDLDVFAERGPSFEIALRAAGAVVERERQVVLKERPTKRGADVHPRVLFLHADEEDILCRLDVRARVDPGAVLVRRLSLIGFADEDFAPNTRPKCSLAEKDDEPTQVALRISQARVGWSPGARPTVTGHVVARVPLSVVGRFVKAGPLKGWVGVSADVRYDERAKLPEARGRIRGGGIELERYKLAKELDVEFETTRDQVRIARAELGIAEGRVTIKEARIDPFEKGVPLRVQQTLVQGAQFTGLMRDLGVAPRTIVNWGLDSVRVTEFGGTLAPLGLDGKLHAETRDFEVFDRAVVDPTHKHMIGVRASTLRGKIGVRPQAVEFYDTHASFGKSQIDVRMVSIGFDNMVRIEVAPSTIDLDDISPITVIPWSGKASLSVKMSGVSSNPLLEGELAIREFNFAKFPIGDIESSKVRFRPLAVDFTDVRGKKGKSEFRASTARLDFNRKGTLAIDALVASDRFELRDFFHMFHFDEDPRFADLSATAWVDSRIRYVIGGPEDRCGNGVLHVKARTDLARAELYGERFDRGKMELDLTWADRDASYRGMTLEVPSFMLQKGAGTVLGSLRMTPGAEISGHVVATGVPLASIQSFGSLGTLVDARGDAVVEIGGSIDQLAMDTHVNVSATRIGSSTLPPSQLDVRLEPVPRRDKVVGMTRCHQPISGAFDRAEYDRDPVEGVFRAKGALFGGQLVVHDLSATRQRTRVVKGDVEAVALDIGALSQLSPLIALADPKPEGKLSGRLHVEELKPLDPVRARASVSLTSLSAGWNGVALELERGAQSIEVANRELAIPGLGVSVKTPGGPQASFDLAGRVTDLGGASEVDATLQLRPLALASLAGSGLGIQRAEGTLTGALKLSGPAASLRYGGGFQLTGGELAMQGLPAPITDAEVEVVIDRSELRVERGSARMGDGTIELTAVAPLRGFELGATRAVVTARSLSVPLMDGVDSTLDADLVATYTPASAAVAKAVLPRVTGTVTLGSFIYKRPITLSADLASIAQRGRRTVFEGYDPADDALEFDITLRAKRALEIKNNMADALLELPPRGLELAGTNQRFGIRGSVNVKPGGRIRLRRNEFEITRGEVEFDDLTRVAPKVDLEATTEYRRYASAGSSPQAESGSGSAQAAATAGGRWLISMHAHGDAEELKVDLSSQPALGQDDIFLLLTVGLTRAELEQARSASIGGSVALEALGTLTGADKVVKEVVPVIDEFRFGSAYSSRSGRTEPTVSIGKRLAQRIRANVTSGLSPESREVRSNVEVEVGKQVSVDVSHGNVNDVSSSSLGNLGADVRWRLEFE